MEQANRDESGVEGRLGESRLHKPRVSLDSSSGSGSRRSIPPTTLEVEDEYDHGSRGLFEPSGSPFSAPATPKGSGKEWGLKIFKRRGTKPDGGITQAHSEKF